MLLVVLFSALFLCFLMTLWIFDLFCVLFTSFVAMTNCPTKATSEGFDLAQFEGPVHHGRKL